MLSVAESTNEVAVSCGMFECLAGCLRCDVDAEEEKERSRRRGKLSRELTKQDEKGGPVITRYIHEGR